MSLNHEIRHIHHAHSTPLPINTYVSIAQEEFEILCFEYGIELDDVVCTCILPQFF